MTSIFDRTRRAVTANPARKMSQTPRRVTFAQVETLDELIGKVMRFEITNRRGEGDQAKGIVLSVHTQEYNGIEYLWLCVAAAGFRDPLMVADIYVLGFESMFMSARTK